MFELTPANTATAGLHKRYFKGLAVKQKKHIKVPEKSSDGGASFRMEKSIQKDRRLLTWLFRPPYKRRLNLLKKVLKHTLILLRLC